MPKFNTPFSNLIAGTLPVFVAAFFFNQVINSSPEAQQKYNSLPIIKKTKEVLGIKTSADKSLIRQSETYDSNYNPDYFSNVLADTDSAAVDTTKNNSTNNSSPIINNSQTQQIVKTELTETVGKTF